MVVKISERITLTDEASESSYGIPVAIIGGKVYGPADLVGNGGGHADLLVEAAAIAARLQGTITTDELTWCERFWK